MKKHLITLAALLSALGLALPVAAQPFPPGVHPRCIMALQGRVPWDYQGNTTWAPANLHRLCLGGRGDQPARCFQRVMHGGVNFGGGTRWEWQNAIDLCHGSLDANATVACFEGMLRVGRPWRDAIPACGPGAAPVIAQPVPPGPPPPVVAQPVPFNGVDPVCPAALQGRVAWDYAGNTTWAPANLERLCRGGRGDQPARCFQQVLHGHVNWGGDVRWEWGNAIDLCHGTQNHEATIRCFQFQVGRGRPWRDAIAACNPNR